ncbi:MAG: OmpA family protein [Acetobacteraceae bacterium]|nr:OmpA family protein [Acetobacteraceae bacterium]
MAKQDKRGKKRPVPIIRREEPAGEGHHGGAWKVAYADFVTAMMAFFLVMWLLNATTEDQRKGLADYFSPNNLMSHASSGTGQPFGGHTAFDQGAMVSDRGSVQVMAGTRTAADEPADEPEPAPEAGESEPRKMGKSESGKTGKGEPAAPTAPAPAKTQPPPSSRAEPAPTPAAAQAPAAEGAAARAAQQAAEQRRFESAAEEIRRAMASDPALAALAGQITVDITPEGLRIQLLDQERQAMFSTGSAQPNEQARLLIATITPTLLRLPGQVSIQGHTDAAPYPGPDRTNWELSAERANAARRMLTDAGLPEQRIRDVSGRADRDLLLPAQPLAAANRRIAITVLRQAPPAPPAPKG